ncbi:MAG: hypothetical protein GY775_19420 [Candidatus Scalindua sp.]|nr:hypothetical protein [Candidatus Scalindua sp.]
MPKKPQVKAKKSPIFCSDLEIIIDKLVAEHGLSKSQVRDIVDSQFRFLKQTITSGGIINKDSDLKDYKSVRLIRLGAFSPSEKKFKYIQKKLKEDV